MFKKSKVEMFVLISISLFSIWEASAFAGTCKNLYEFANNQKSLKLPESPERVLRGDGFTDAKVRKASAAYEISRHGVQELLQGLYSMDNLIYYVGTAILSKGNVLVDGPGGGGKTLAIRKIFEAQLAAVKSWSRQDQKTFNEDMFKLVKEIQRILEEEKEAKRDTESQIFTLQLHALVSETAITGGPNPFKYIEKGEYEIDYSKAMIAAKNMFAILDEIEKAPPALQMTLLSILNERQALAGNKVIETLLESVAATTNASAGELIAQAPPHEIGGRKALVDRFPIKIHVVNVGHSALDNYLFIENIKAGRQQKKYTIIDLRNLRPLMKKIEISKEMLEAAVSISTQMVSQYMIRYNREKNGGFDGDSKEVSGPLTEQDGILNGDQREATGFFPPFSGSTRSQMRLLPQLQAAYLMRQLIQGVPFDSLSLKMNPKDLVDLAPTLLHGGPEFIAPQLGARIHFIQYDDLESVVMATSNSKPDPSKYPGTTRADADPHSYLVEHSISVGNYDPSTQMFSYRTAKHGQLRRVFYDLKKRQLVIHDDDVRFELGQDFEKSDQPIFPNQSEKMTRGRYEDLNARLFRLHLQLTDPQKTNRTTVPIYQLDGRLNAILKSAPLRMEGRAQLEDIREFHTKFLQIVNAKILELNGVPQTKLDSTNAMRLEDRFIKEAKALTERMKAALETGNKMAILEASAATIRQAFFEFETKFKNSGSSFAGLFKTLAAGKNAIMSGGPGSAKTMINRMVLEKELEWIHQAQLINLNGQMAGLLDRFKDIDGSQIKGTLFIKQFNPMSSEGDIVGRIDLKELRKGKGYVYNRTGSMSAKDVFFALLDEFEKAPPGVKTSLLSLLNERQVLGGDEVLKSRIQAIILATNSTPGEFIIGQGEFSTAFPIYDRIQKKIYAFNQLEEAHLVDLLTQAYFGITTQVHSPLFLMPLQVLSKEVRFSKEIEMLLSEIYTEMEFKAVERSEKERKMHKGNAEQIPDFFMNSRGESLRSLVSLRFEELPMEIIINRILAGENPTQLIGLEFDLKDLKAFADLFLTYNFAYEIRPTVTSGTFIQFEVVAKDLSRMRERIDLRDTQTLKNLKWEADLLAGILNRNVGKFMESRLKAIRDNRDLFPSAFLNTEARVRWLKEMGFKDEELKSSYPNVYSK